MNSMFLQSGGIKRKLHAVLLFSLLVFFYPGKFLVLCNHFRALLSKETTLRVTDHRSSRSSRQFRFSSNTHTLRWLRRNAQRSVQSCKMAKVSRYKCTGGSRSFHAESKSKPACLHRHGAREKSGILNINIPIF